MTSPRDLLRHRGAPPPLAVTMKTEIRSDGGVFFKVLQSPLWSYGRSTASVWQWAAPMERQQLRRLWNYLREPDSLCGAQVEALIDYALCRLMIGRYLGTFVDSGSSPVVVRMMFGIEPDRQVTENDLNREIHKLVKYAEDGAAAPSIPGNGNTPGPDDLMKFKAAAKALAMLRGYWFRSGLSRIETRSVMLTQIDVDDLCNGYRSPFGDGT